MPRSVNGGRCERLAILAPYLGELLTTLVPELVFEIVVKVFMIIVVALQAGQIT